jgi:hypothetical protein
MASDSPASPPVSAGAADAAEPAVPGAPTPETWSLLGDAVQQGRVALEAQLAVWKYSLFQIVVLIALAVPMSIAGFLLIIHGFLLLDSVLDYALAKLEIAVWFSPLIRGLAYFGVPALGAVIVGIGAIPKSKRKKKDAHAKS